MSIADDPAVSVCFAVTIDNDSYNLGLFNTCDGLGCEVTVESRQEGGNNDFIYQLPGPIKYTNIKFTRPINGGQCQSGGMDFRQPGLEWGSGARRSIQALALDGATVVCSWSLREVFRSSGPGPQFSAEGPK